jgi:hypothetical protein
LQKTRLLAEQTQAQPKETAAPEAVATNCPPTTAPDGFEFSTDVVATPKPATSAPEPSEKAFTATA